MFNRYWLILLVTIILSGGAVGFVWFQTISQENTTLPLPVLNIVVTPTPTGITLQTPPTQKILPTDYHVFQSFNNCGPAALSMTLSHYGIQKSQEELGRALRPYQNPQGDNDDKSTTLEEMAEKSKEYGFVPYHRPNGNLKLIKLFITYDMPILTRTWTHPNEDIGHYRVVKGYNESTGQLIQDDSLQDKNLWFTYDEFNIMWEKFSYEYLVLVPKEKVAIAEAILGEGKDPKQAWKRAAERAQERLAGNPDDVNARFNLSVAYYHLGDYQKSVEEYEKVEARLPFRTLWYQIEPIQAYYELKNYERVFAITDRILSNQNRAFSELYFIRGQIYLTQGRREEARREFKQAMLYNQNYLDAKEALEKI